MNRRIVQLALVGAISLVAATQARANIAYSGGRVLPSVRIIPMFYGNTWTASDIASTRSYLTELADYIRGAKNPAGKQTLYAQYGVTGAQIDQLPHCFGCVDSNPRALGGVEGRNIIHGIQQENGNFYDADEVFVLLLGPGYSTTAAGCGFYGPEGDGKYYAVVPRDCAVFKRTISSQVLSIATNANFDGTNALLGGWDGAVSACFGHTWNFGNGDIALPWNNHLGGCPALSTDPNTPFDAKQGEVLHVLVSTVAGGLFHTIRYPTAWTPFGDVKAAVGSDPGRFTDVDAQTTLGVFTHVVVNSGDKLYHTIRTDKGWTPFVDVNAATNAGSTSFPRLSLAEVDGDLHVCATTSNGGVWHAIRFRNGSWTGFGDVLAQTGTPPGQLTDIDCAGFGSEMHIAIATRVGVFHAIRSASGWTALDDVETHAGQIPGSNFNVSVAQFAGDLHLIVDSGSVDIFHTARHNSGSWVPFTVVPNNTDLSLSSAGTQDFLHVVTAGFQSRGVEHQTRDQFGNWSAVGDVYSAAGNNPGVSIFVAAASGIAY